MMFTAGVSREGGRAIRDGSLDAVEEQFEVKESRRFVDTVRESSDRVR